jgi:hypothetical protein
LTTSLDGGGPLGITTLGLVFSAAGSGVVLVLVALLVVVLLVVTAAAVWPPEGASCTPGAVELPQPATATPSPNRAHMRVIGLRIAVAEGSEARSAGDALEHGCIDVEVRVHRADIV